MTTFLQQFVNATALGGVYALVALGLTLVYGVMRVPNFAHGGLYMLGAYFAYASLTGLGVGPGRIAEVLALLELTSMGGRRVSEYSLGQRQRLGVASAILADPKVLVLDEPTSGLDPMGIGLIHRIVTGLATSGCAVILSTHHLREIATYAHTVGIMTAGRLVDTIDLRTRQSAYRFRVEEPAMAAAALEKLPFVRRAAPRAPFAIAQLNGPDHVPDALRALGEQGLRVYEASPDHFDLYEYYRERVEHA